MTAISSRLNVSPVNTNRLIYSVPYGKCATVSVNITNYHETQSRRARILITQDGIPHTVADFVENKTAIPPNGILERTGLVMKAGENLYVTAFDGDELSARIYGFEENA